MKHVLNVLKAEVLKLSLRGVLTISRVELNPFSPKRERLVIGRYIGVQRMYSKGTYRNHGKPGSEFYTKRLFWTFRFSRKLLLSGRFYPARLRILLHGTVERIRGNLGKNSVILPS